MRTVYFSIKQNLQNFKKATAVHLKVANGGGGLMGSMSNTVVGSYSGGGGYMDCCPPGQMSHVTYNSTGACSYMKVLLIKRQLLRS